MPDVDAYVICTSPRSGSTLLCKLLAVTGTAGDPGSYFHRDTVAEWLAYFQLAPAPGASPTATLASVFEAALAKGRAGTGIFGLRLQRHSFEFFIRQLTVLHPQAAGDRQRLEAAFGRTLFIHLTRIDKVEQAVSYVRVEQTGLWHVAPDGTELERLAPPAPPRYDAEAIATCRDRFAGYDRDWENWFAAEGIAPVRLTYETLSADPSGSLRKVLLRLGVDPDAADDATPAVAKLADRTNRDWVARFRSEEGIT